MSKIGIGIVTCNRNDFLHACIESLDLTKVDEKVIVNDGALQVRHNAFHVINNEENIGVGKSKNKILRYLYEQNCDYMFIIEDDTLIKDNNVFDEYIKASKRTGIQHFNYGPGTPFNRKQNENFDIHNRHKLEQESEPNPRKVIDYGDVKISLYQHVAGMFSFFTRKVIEDVGYIDEDFYNAWEHVEHTYRIIKKGYHPPFWFFADIYNSHNFLTEHRDAIEKSAISKNSETFLENVRKGGELYIKKHGHAPNNPPYVSEADAISSLKDIKNESSISSQYV
jgi:GT2 family glycosyltransferase